MTELFEVGDFVRVIDDTHTTNLKTGEIRPIVDVVPGEFPYRLRDIPGFWRADRFERVDLASLVERPSFHDRDVEAPTPADCPIICVSGEDPDHLNWAHGVTYSAEELGHNSGIAYRWWAPLVIPSWDPPEPAIEYPTNRHDRLLAIADQIEAHPDTWYQGTWITGGGQGDDRPIDVVTKHACGTAACVAGWAVYFTDPTTVNWDKYTSWTRAGMETLEIDEHLAGWLFDPNRDTLDMPKLLRLIASHSIRGLERLARVVADLYFQAAED